MKQIKWFCFFLAAALLASCGSLRKAPRRVEAAVVEQPMMESAQQRKFDYYFLEALRMKEKKAYADAFALLQHCLELNPASAAAHYEISQYYLFLRMLPQTCESLERAVLLAPDNFWYSQALASLYQQQQEWDKAIALYEQMVQRFPDKQDPLFSLMSLYNRQQRYAEVVTILDKLEKRMGKSEQLSMEKFRMYLQMDNAKKAFQEIEALVKEYPMDLRYPVILGDLYMQNGKPEEAYNLYQQVLAAEPDQPMALYSLASYYEQTGQEDLYRSQLDTLLLNSKVSSEIKLNVMRQLIVSQEQSTDSTELIRLFERVMDEDLDDPQIPMLYAQYLLSKKQEEAAVPVLEKVVDIDPTNNAARLMLVSAAVKKEDFRQIIKVCEPGIEATPESLELYYYLAIAYNQAAQPDSVFQVCQKALKQVNAQSNKELVSEIYSILGDVYHTQGHLEECFAAYDSALEYHPSNIAALNNYAYFLSLEHRDLDRAEEMSYKTVKAEPHNATYLDTYAWILFVKGNYAQARIYIDSAMKSEEEKSAAVVEHCGDIYFMNGDVEAALKYWKQSLQLGNDSKILKEKIEKKQYIAE